MYRVDAGSARASPTAEAHRAIRLSGRLGVPALLAVVGAIHLNLYAGEDYREIPTIGRLFLVTVVTAFVLAVVVAGWPALWSWTLAGGFSLGVLGGYLLTLFLPDGLFGFKEPAVSYSGAASIAAETLIAAGSAIMALKARRAHRAP